MKNLQAENRTFGKQILLIALATLTISSASAQESTTAGNLEDLRHQRKVMETLRDLDEVLSTVRDHIHPSDFIEKTLIKESGWATLLSEATKLSEQLSKEFVSPPSWLKDSIAKAKAAKQIAAATDLITRFVKAVARAETSSAAEKLEDLAQITKDMEAVVGVLVSVNPVLGAYLTVMTKAIEGIAESATVIAAAAERTNKAIEEAGKSLGPKTVKPDTSHPLDAEIEKLEERIYALESERNRKAFEEVKAAETACAGKQNSTRREMIKLRSEVAALARALKRKETALKGLDHQIATIQLMIKLADREIRRLELVFRGAGATPEEVLNARNKLDSERARKKIDEEERADFKRRLPALKRQLEAELKADRAQLEKVRPRLAKFNRCVGCGLAAAKFATRAYLIERFPRYLGKLLSSSGAGKAKDTGLDVQKDGSLDVILSPGTNWEYSFTDPTSNASWNTTTGIGGVWSSGAAPFGSTSTGDFGQSTYWQADRSDGNDLWLRKNLDLTGFDLSTVAWDLGVDNGFTLYINGQLVASQNAEGFTYR